MHALYEDVCHSSCAFSRLTSAWYGTCLTGFVPGFAHVVATTADAVCNVESQLILTCGAIVFAKAKAFSHVSKLDKGKTKKKTNCSVN